MIVVDTNVLSETSKARPDDRAARWLVQSDARLWMPTIVLAELRYGVEKLPHSRQRDALEEWFAKLTARFARRKLPFDSAAAEAHGRLRAKLKRIGRSMDAPDSYIAAIALASRAPLATHNLKHFQHAEVELIDPWTA